ncbi:MAG: TolC family protein [Planctomycetota bacterium]
MTVIPSAGTGGLGERRPGKLALRLLLLGSLLLGAAVGCQRGFYRRQADAEANCLIDGKAGLVNSDGQLLRIDIDPRSRMFSAEDPDRPAMPPDDPVSHAFLECVDGKRGAKANRCAARTPFVENPAWLASLPRDGDGTLELDLASAVQLALLHSPDYQSQLEELYLSALDVAFERFRLDAQFFGGSSVFFTADGRDRSGAGNASSLLSVNTSRSPNRFRLEKLTATGGEIVVGFANSLIWQFSGANDYTSTTLLDFSIIQPLLRTGGRAVILERLTIAERALLANVRAMERFRRGFYLSIATGRDAGPGPSRRGGFFGGSGLEGFTGIGGGGFGRVGGGGGGFTGGAGAAAAGGYIGLLQQSQELKNQRSNIAALRTSVDQLQASYDAGRIDRFQVDLARQALFNAQSRLLSAEADYQSTVDDFLIDLGLPPDIMVRLVDPLLDPFQLRPLELSDLQRDVADNAAALRQAALERAERPGAEPAPQGSGSRAEVVPLGPAIPTPNGPTAKSGAQADRGDPRVDPPTPADLAEQAIEQIASVEADYEKLLAALPDRKTHLEQLAGRDEVATAQIDAGLLTPARLDERVKRLRQDLDNLEGRIRVATAALQAPEPPAHDFAYNERIRKGTTELAALLLELSLVQARTRLDTLDITPTELTDEDALAIARLHRRDWKNARASLVDAWRLVNFNANALLSDLDITFSGDIGNVGDNPLRLRDTNGRLRVGIAFDGPITRLSERNIYRQALIEFQQARRSYYQFVDRVHQGLRASLRQVRLNEINFELRREAVLVAIAQVDLTQIRLSEPPKPGEETQFGDTTARDLVQALSDLLSVQNDFLSVWVNNRVQLLNLEFDLGLMQLDQQGQRVPLALPLADFADAVVCPMDGGPERLPADLQLPEGVTPLPLGALPPGETAPLCYPLARPVAAARPAPGRGGGLAQPASVSTGRSLQASVKRLPTPPANTEPSQPEMASHAGAAGGGQRHQASPAAVKVGDRASKD